MALTEVDLSVLDWSQAQERWQWCIDQQFKEPCEKLKHHQNENGCYSDWADYLLKFKLTDEELNWFILRWQ